MTIKVGFFSLLTVPECEHLSGGHHSLLQVTQGAESHGKPTLTRQLRKWSPKLYLAVDCRHWFENSEWSNQISDNEPQGEPQGSG